MTACRFAAIFAADAVGYSRLVPPNTDDAPVQLRALPGWGAACLTPP